MQYHAIPCNTIQYHAIPCNAMQFHASLITADRAYHCPVGSIRQFLLTWTAGITFYLCVQRNIWPRASLNHCSFSLWIINSKNIVPLNIRILLAIKSKRTSSGGHLLSCWRRWEDGGFWKVGFVSFVWPALLPLTQFSSAPWEIQGVCARKLVIYYLQFLSGPPPFYS